ncbi:hypothetical protein HDU96_001255 [Phlyctochytrium bullatum]|nr:hypothetical protein HDU96_001255 [Phlyctochytrium bullatum]
MLGKRRARDESESEHDELSQDEDLDEKQSRKTRRTGKKSKLGKGESSAATATKKEKEKQAEPPKPPVEEVLISPYAIYLVDATGKLFCRLKVCVFGAHKSTLMNKTVQKQREFKVLVHRGATGTSGQGKDFTFRSRDAAIERFKKLFKEHTGNDWDNLAHFQKQIGKYAIADEPVDKVKTAPKLESVQDPVDEDEDEELPTDWKLSPIPPVCENNLQRFYSEYRVRHVAEWIARIDFGWLADGWKLPKGMVYELCSLALYDIVFFCNDSSSMKFEEGGRRIEDLQTIIEEITEFAWTLSFDSNGVSVRFTNSRAQGDELKTAIDIQDFFARASFPWGPCTLGTKLESNVIDPLVLRPARERELHKPVLVIAITDREPFHEPHDTLHRVICHTKRELPSMGFPKEAVAFSVVQCGSDWGTHRYLKELNGDWRVGKYVDCTGSFEMEAKRMEAEGFELTPPMYLMKVSLGAVDENYKGR